MIQVIAHTFFIYCNFAYSLFQYFQISNIFNQSGGDMTHKDTFASVENYLIAMCAVLGVSSLAFSVLDYPLYKEYGWEIYKKLGADVRIKG